MNTELDTEPAKYISLDLFPASVHVGSEDSPSLKDDYKVIVTDNYFYVITDTPEGAVLEVKEPLVSFEGNYKTGHVVETDQNVYYIRKSTNCGCGTRLRSLRPFKGVIHASRLSKK